MIVLTDFRRHFSNAFFPRLSEWMMAGHLLLLGYILTINTMLMQTGKESHRFLLMIADQNGWAIMLLLLGLVRFIILIINGAYRRSPHLRALTAVLSCFVWFQVAVSFYSIMGWAFAAYAIASITDLMNIMRCMRDARIVDDAHRHGASTGGQS